MTTQFIIIQKNLSVYHASRSILNNARPFYTTHDAYDFLSLVNEYEGWGRCRRLIDTTSEEYKFTYHELEQHAQRKSDTLRFMREIQSATLTSFYTPTEVAKTITKYALDAYKSINGEDACTFLDCSCGSGAFLTGLETNDHLKVIETCEKDEITRTILQARLKAMETVNHSLDHCATFDCTHHTFESVPKDWQIDVIASNIPFGDVQIYDNVYDKRGGIHRASLKKIHNYFFLNAVERLGKGGVLAFITSRGFLSSEANMTFRSEILRHGNIINIVRLPDNLFPTIEVGTDLIVFQKTSLEGSNTTSTELNNAFRYGWSEQTLKSLGKQHTLPNCDISQRKNQYGKQVYYYKYQGTDLPADLLNILNSEPHSVTNSEIESRPNPNPQSKMKTPPTAKRPNPQSSTLHPQSATTAPVSEASASATTLADFGIFSLLTGADLEKSAQVMAECMKEMCVQYNTKSNPFTNEQRNIFREMYYSFIKVCSFNAGKQYKSMHEILMKLDVKCNSFMSQLEKRVDNTWQPADIFFAPLVSQISTLTPTEALASSLNLFGKVNLSHMEERTKMTSAQLTEALKEQMFFNPISGIYEEAETWVCGNVVKKAREARSHLNKWKDGERLAAERAIEALTNARPMTIPFNDIDCQFGSRWIPIEFYKQFICHLFDVPQNHASDVNIIYSTATDDYVGEIPFYGCSQWKVKNYYGAEVVMWALRGSVPNFTETIDGKTYPDEESRALALKCVEQVKERWVQFTNLPQSSHLREEIERIYNDRFNSEVRPKIDGSFQTFPDLCLGNLGIADLYPSQKDCIWMLKKNGGGICWHEVGTGKTLIMCVASYEMKRLGLVKKPVIIGLKANVGQIAETYRKAYPNARLLFPRNNDFSAKNRIDFFNQIKNNDWDCIIMSHEQFGRLPLALETEIQLKQERIEALDDVLQSMEDGHFDGRLLKGLQKRRERMSIELDRLYEKHRSKADKIEDFHELGIDHIFIDESQQFKNLGFETRNTRVAGIGNPEGSQRADHLLNCIRDIQYRTGNDLCATFLSGTIVSNSLTELYIIFKYLRPNALAEQAIHSFDAWATVFCEKKTDYETNIVNQIRPKERFAAYVNLPELSKFLSQICDYRTSVMCGIDAPKGKVHFEATAPTEQQSIMLDRLVKFVGNGKWSELGIAREAPANLDKSLMLVATNVARQVALDPRMLDNCMTFGDEDGNKVRRCAMNIYDIYQRTNDSKGTQFVFNDISTYDRDKWNMQSAIRDVLVKEYLIPAEEICFINAVPDSKRLETFEKMNDGQIRILFGSTTKLGTGVNAQRRAVAIHHLDIPWRPSDMEQRNGRALRQGNELAKACGNTVDVYLYATERTLDGYKFNLLKAKQTFIDQLNNGTLSVRRIDDSILKDSDSVSYAEYVSLLSGNTDLLKKAKLDAKVMALESQRKNFYTNRNNAISKVASMESENKRDAEWIALAEQDIAYHTDINAETIPAINGVDIQTLKDAGKAIYDIDAEYMGKDYKVFGSCGSLQLAVRHATDICNPNGSNYFYVIGQSGQYYACCMNGNRTGKLLHIGHEHAAHFPFDTLNVIKRTINEKTQHIAMNNALIPENRKVANSEWSGEAELKALKSELDALNLHILESIKDSDKSQEQATTKVA